MAGPETTVLNTFGVLLITYSMSMWLYGVFCAQVIWYYKMYPDDRWSFKLIVFFLWAVEAIHNALASEMIWNYLVVRGAGKEFFYLIANWGSIAMVIPAEICVAIVDVFYILRIWKLTNKSKYALLLFIPVVVGAAHAIGCVITISRFPYAWELKKGAYFMTMTISCKLLTDIANTITLCTLLIRRQSMIARRSKVLLKALFVGTLTTGVLTSVFTIVYYATYLTMSKNSICVGLYLLRTKICANAMLASLNSRNVLRSMSDQPIPLEMLLSTKHSSSPGNM